MLNIRQLTAPNYSYIETTHMSTSTTATASPSTHNYNNNYNNSGNTTTRRNNSRTPSKDTDSNKRKGGGGGGGGGGGETSKSSVMKSKVFYFSFCELLSFLSSLSFLYCSRPIPLEAVVVRLVLQMVTLRGFIIERCLHDSNRTNTLLASQSIQSLIKQVGIIFPKKKPRGLAWHESV